MLARRVFVMLARRVKNYVLRVFASERVVYSYTVREGACLMIHEIRTIALMPALSSYPRFNSIWDVGSDI
ncbi:hypothetical protein BGX38DRAFT_1177210 [Terfezia claveryi]|nr:hypothetical protein BGX38DRAFT_1177210 [Terfezia claveryi]